MLLVHANYSKASGEKNVDNSTTIILPKPMATLFDFHVIEIG